MCPDGPDEKPGADAPGAEPAPTDGNGGDYTDRPSQEEPEEGGATRDEDEERPDHPEGRERT